MRPEENIINKKNRMGMSRYDSVSSTYNPSAFYGKLYGKTCTNPEFRWDRKLTLCDPITQICKRIEAFFRGCNGITVKYCVNNSEILNWKKNEYGEYVVDRKCVDGNEFDVFYSEDQISELRLYVDDELQANALANVIRHRHVVSEECDILSPIDKKEAICCRDHVLLVRVMLLDGIDPMDPEQGGIDPYSTEDDDNGKLIHECYGMCPIRWNDMDNYGVVERLAPYEPDDEEYPATPHGFPGEYEQYCWENGFKGMDIDEKAVNVTAEQAIKWKWKWLKEALRDNPNVVDMSFEYDDGMNTWRFIECNRLPVVFNEDNLLSARGFNSILPADLLPMVFSVFSRFNISTYARRSLVK